MVTEEKLARLFPAGLRRNDTQTFCSGAGLPGLHDRGTGMPASATGASSSFPGLLEMGGLRLDPISPPRGRDSSWVVPTAPPTA